MVTIPEDRDGYLDVDVLRRELARHAERPLRVGSFGVASIVTGVVRDSSRIAAVLHDHGALSVWDYRGCAPYVEVNAAAGSGKDAVVVSPGAFVGGPGAAEVLVVRRSLAARGAAVAPGGGIDTTPGMIGAIRAGLAVHLQQAVGLATIRARQEEMLRAVMAAWNAEPAVEILGDLEARRASVVSVRVRTPADSDAPYLPDGFVVALLNDLFGIQTRAGSRSGMPDEGQPSMEDDDGRACPERQGGAGTSTPGWVAVHLSYVLDDAVLDYVIEAVRLVARQGWRMLGEYAVCPDTGAWRHRCGPVEPPLRLTDVRFTDNGTMTWPRQSTIAPPGALAAYLDEARRIIENADPDLAAPTTTATPPHHPR